MQLFDNKNLQKVLLQYGLHMASNLSVQIQFHISPMIG